MTRGFLLSQMVRKSRLPFTSMAARTLHMKALKFSKHSPVSLATPIRGHSTMSPKIRRK